jgi:hypothetical protein
MLKRALLIIMLLILMIVLVGCAKIIDPTGREREVSYGLVEIDKIEGNGDSIICYDPTTMICYVLIDGYSRLALSPYYIIGKDGTPEIAIYGENYE